jgi:orotate phosphoribosyltransferase
MNDLRSLLDAPPHELRSRLREVVRAESVRHGDFVLSSGKRSSLYVDLRRTTTHPEGALLTAWLFLDLLAGDDLQAVGGPTLGADPIVGAMAALSALRADPRPVFMVRKAQKGHGMQNQVEGHLEPGWRVAVLDDVVTGGGSLLTAVEAVTAAGAEVARVLTLVDRSGGSNALTGAGYSVESLFRIEDVVDGSNP